MGEVDSACRWTSKFGRQSQMSRGRLMSLYKIMSVSVSVKLWTFNKITMTLKVTVTVTLTVTVKLWCF